MTPSSLATNSIDTQIPRSPLTTNPELYGELTTLYNGIAIIQLELSRVGRFAVKCSETIAAGAMVAVSNNAGALVASNAVASATPKVAVGFALMSGTSGTWIVVCISGGNQYLSGLTIGSQYYLSDATPGGIITAKPVGAGKIVQPIGFAWDASTLILNIASNFTQL